MGHILILLSSEVSAHCQHLLSLTQRFIHSLEGLTLTKRMTTTTTAIAATTVLLFTLLLLSSEGSEAKFLKLPNALKGSKVSKLTKYKLKRLIQPGRIWRNWTGNVKWK